MKKFAISMLALGAIALCGVAVAPTSARADDDEGGGGKCFRTKFETKLAEDACKKGGQGEAKKAFKAWMNEAKKTDATLACKSCHSKMAPEFPLTADGLEKYKKLGGK